MTSVTSRNGLGVLALVGAFALAACSGPSSSLNPTAPSAAAGSSASLNQDPSAPCLPPNEVDPKTGECLPPPPPPPPPPGDQGCTPGYWKANAKKGADEWPPYSPAQTVGSVFSAGSFNSATLLQALEFGGGSGVSGATQNLLRAAVAAVLNADNSSVAFPRTAASIKAAVNAAVASGDRSAILTLASALDADNNLGCPLDNNGK